MNRTKLVTATSIEKSIRQQRDLEDRRRELQAFSIESAKLMSAVNCQSKVENRRQQMQNVSTKSGKEKDDKLLEFERNKRIQEQITSQRNDIAALAEKEYLDAERHRIEIQRICDDSPELKELEKALKIAYLNKDRAIQQEEKLLLAQREKERILAMEQEMEYNRLNAMKADQMKIESQKNSWVEQRHILQQQIDERKRQVAQDQRQAELDREMVDAIVNKINDEDEADYRRKKDMQAKSAQMIKDFEMQRKREKEAALAREREEEARIRAYQQSVESRNENVAAIKQAKREDEDRILKQIIEETERKRREEEEYNSLRDLLWEEELERKRSQEVQERQMKAEKSKKEMFEMNSRILQSKQQQRQYELEDEARLIEVMKAKFAEDERREREEEEARQISKYQHKKTIERQLEEKRFMTEQQRAQELKLFEENQRKEEYRKKVIQEARKRLLEEHAAKLKGYLPPGTLASQDEYRNLT